MENSFRTLSLNVMTTQPDQFMTATVAVINDVKITSASTSTM